MYEKQFCEGSYVYGRFHDFRTERLNHVIRYKLLNTKRLKFLWSDYRIPYSCFWGGCRRTLKR